MTSSRPASNVRSAVGRATAGEQAHTRARAKTVDQVPPAGLAVVIQAIEDDPADSHGYPSGIRIAREPGRDVWVFYRRSNPDVNDGVLLQWAYRRNPMPTHLLDMGTATPGLLSDAELPVRSSFTDLVRRFKVTCDAVSADAGLARVIIEDLDPPEPDTLPVINVWVKDPSTGATIPDRTTLSGTVTYVATAYDPDIGTTNGAGISELRMFLYRTSDALHKCLVKEGGPPCGETDPMACSGPLVPTPDTYEWTFDTTTLWCNDLNNEHFLDGVYQLVVVVNPTATGQYENFGAYTHMIDNSGTNAPCLGPDERCSSPPSCPDD